MIRVRIDDFPSSLDREKHRHTLSAYREFHRVLSECLGGHQYLLGVIPGRCTIDDLLFLRNETNCVIGMHGTDHDEARLNRNGGNQFEPWSTAINMHREIQEHLHALQYAAGRGVQIYMPPRNVIDERTIGILVGLGIQAFTSGPETDKAVRARHPLMAIHSEPPVEYGRTDEMLRDGTITQLLDRAIITDVTLTLHWTWESNIGLHNMKKFLNLIPPTMFKDFDV